MNNRPPFGLIISTFSIALIAYLLAMVIVILGGISERRAVIAAKSSVGLMTPRARKDVCDAAAYLLLRNGAEARL